MLLVPALPRELAAQEATCVVHIKGDPTGQVFGVENTPTGPLLAAWNGLFRYDGKMAIRVAGETGEVTRFYHTPFGLLLKTENGLFRYEHGHVVRVEGNPTGYVKTIQNESNEVLVAGGNGLFRYDGVRISHVGGEPTGGVTTFHDSPDGLLVGAENGLFRYDGKVTIRVDGENTGRIKIIHSVAGTILAIGGKALFRYQNGRTVRVQSGKAVVEFDGIHDAPGGVLLQAFDKFYRYDGKSLAELANGTTDFARIINTPQGPLLYSTGSMFRYDGTHFVRVDNQAASHIISIHNARGGPLVSADNGLFRFDGSQLIAVPGDPTGNVNSVYVDGAAVLIAADNGLFRYDGKRTVRVEGDRTGSAENIFGVRDGFLLSAGQGLFFVVTLPFSAAKVNLDNLSQLRGAAPNSQGVHTRWVLTHPCARFADRYGLRVVAKNAKTRDVAIQSVSGFAPSDDATKFDSWVPIAQAGSWNFRIVAMQSGTEVGIGKPTEEIRFVVPGFLGWLEAWWQYITAGFIVFVVALNLAVVGAARYSAAAWRLATDKFWGRTALSLQGALLRQSQTAQLWLLDRYVRERRSAIVGEGSPFLSLPLTGADGEIADSDAVLAHLASARHVWIQGGAGMGKTAIFLHLCQLHFGGLESTAFTIIHRDGYILVPIEARRFADLSVDEKGASAWVVGCIVSVLSERGLSFEDRSLLRAMLSKGTLGIAIDGLNEVGRNQAVAAFAAEFPATPLFVTSQESTEPPFEVWRLPATVAAHVNGLLTLYLGEKRSALLAMRLRETGLIQHLRSGYDVRLIIELAEADPHGANLPDDRVGLYRAAVAAAWPEGDDRLELLQAAAWKLVSERGPNEDKRRLKPDVDAPSDLLKQLEAVRERSGRSIRLIRGAPSGYEFVHDQMNAYLAACWFNDRPTVAIMNDLLKDTKVWLDGYEAQRTLWRFVAAMLDRARLETLWVLAGDDDRRAVLGRALAERAEAEGWELVRPAGRRLRAVGATAR